MTCDLIGWCALPPEAQAAWAQAIGTVLAIGAAVWIGRDQVASSKALIADERRRQATIAATGLSLAFEAVKFEAEFRLALLEPAHARLPDDDEQLLGEVQSERLLASLELESAHRLGAVDQQALLFEQQVGQMVVMAAGSATSFNRNIKRALLAPRDAWRVRDMRALHTRMIESLRRVGRLAGNAVDVLRPVHGIVAPDPPETTEDSELP